MRFLIIAAAAGLAGCSTAYNAAVDAPLSPTFGRAVASMQAQIIPAPVSDLPPESSGARAAAAIERYHEGKVRPLEAQSTSGLTVNLVPASPAK